MMEGLGDHSLACSWFTAQQNSCIWVSHPLHHVVDFLHPGGVAYNFLNSVFGRQLSFEAWIFLAQGFLFFVDAQDSFHRLGNQSAGNSQETNVLFRLWTKSVLIDPVNGERTNGVAPGEDGNAEKWAFLLQLIASATGTVKKMWFIANLGNNDGFTGGNNFTGNAFS